MTEGKEYRFQTEIFLRELISNASDAIDRRYALALSSPDGQWGPADRNAYSINLILQKEKRLLWIRDNGIGMDEDDLYRCLGTIAQSGTAKAAEENEEALSFSISGKMTAMTLTTAISGNIHCTNWSADIPTLSAGRSYCTCRFPFPEKTANRRNDGDGRD